MFGNNPYPYMPQGPAYQRPAFQQPMYPQAMAQPAMMQDGSIQARFVSGREEAVASNVMPGSMFLFHDRAGGMIYSKLIDPQTGMPEFKAYAEVRTEQTPQYVTMDMLQALQNDIDQRFAALVTKTSRKAVASNDSE